MILIDTPPPPPPLSPAPLSPAPPSPVHLPPSSSFCCYWMNNAVHVAAAAVAAAVPPTNLSLVYSCRSNVRAMRYVCNQGNKSSMATFLILYASDISIPIHETCSIAHAIDRQPFPRVRRKSRRNREDK